MKKIASSTCSHCGKPLSDPVSIARGIGPDCWAKRLTDRRKEQTGNIFGNRANYTWGIDGQVLWLKDQGGPGRSLTNDLENALAEIQGQVDQPINGFLIIYRDSDDGWDGVTLTKFDLRAVCLDAEWLADPRYPNYHAQGLHIDFYYIGEKTYEAAKRKALVRQG